MSDYELPQEALDKAAAELSGLPPVPSASAAQ